MLDTYCRIVETDQWLKCLLCELEDLSSNPPDSMLEGKKAEHDGELVIPVRGDKRILRVA